MATVCNRVNHGSDGKAIRTPVQALPKLCPFISTVASARWVPRGNITGQPSRFNGFRLPSLLRKGLGFLPLRNKIHKQVHGPAGVCGSVSDRARLGHRNVRWHGMVGEFPPFHPAGRCCARGRVRPPARGSMSRSTSHRLPTWEGNADQPLPASLLRVTDPRSAALSLAPWH